MPLDGVVPGRRLPGLRLGRPRVLSAEEWARPGGGCVGQLFWAISAAVIANIIAPQFQERTVGPALVGSGAQRLGLAVAEAMRCLTSELAGINDVRRSLFEKHKHGWPMAVVEARPLSRAARKLLLAGRDDPSHNLIASVSRLDGCCLALSGRWTMVVGEAPVSMSDELLELASLLLPAYLHDACQRRVHFPGDDCLQEEVLRDLAGFCGRCYGPAEQVLAARQVLTPAGSASALAEVLLSAIAAGSLRIFEAALPRSGALIWVKQGLLLSDDAIAQLFASAAAPAPGREVIIRQLKAAHALAAEVEGGLVIAKRWWRRMERRYGPGGESLISAAL